jgi:hypothetical protein
MVENGGSKFLRNVGNFYHFVSGRLYNVRIDGLRPIYEMGRINMICKVCGIISYNLFLGTTLSFS